MWSPTGEADEAVWDVTPVGEPPQEDLEPDWLVSLLAAVFTALVCVLGLSVSVAHDLVSLCRILC